MTGPAERPAGDTLDESRSDSSDVSPANPRAWVDWFRRRRESIRSRPVANRVYRCVVGVVGAAIVIGGLGLIPLPGPGWVIVFVGLAVLATEFTWAARLEKFTRDRVRAWTQWLGRQSIWVRVLVGLATLVMVLLIFWGLFALTSVPGWIPDAVVPSLPGL